MSAAPSPGIAPDLVLLRSRTGAALVATTVLASAACSLDASASQVAVPAIGRSLHAGVAGVQWTLTGYLLAVAALLLLAGALADRFGRRRLVTVGLSTMLVAAVSCTLAPSIGVLIAARIAQGIGGAMVVPSSLAMLNGTLRSADRARGIGIWAGLETLAISVGPYVAGWLVDDVTWRVVYLLSAPLILIALVVLQRVPETSSERRSQPIDIIGGGLAVLGLGGLVYALTVGPGAGWLAARVIVTAVVGLGALTALVVVEGRRRAPMLRRSLFASRQFDAINVGTFVLYGALAAAAYLVFLQCELRLGYSAAQAGAALIPETVMFLVLAPISGALVGRLGPRWLMVMGIVLVAAGLILVLRRPPGRVLRHGDSARGAAVGHRDRGCRHPADRGSARRRPRCRPGRSVRDQRCLRASRRVAGDCAGAGVDRRHRRSNARWRTGRRLPARDARHGRPLRARRCCQRGVRLRRAALGAQHGASGTGSRLRTAGRRAARELILF